MTLAVHTLSEGRPTIVASYHPSRQNTQTDRLTEEMLDGVVALARKLVAESASDD